MNFFGISWVNITHITSKDFLRLGLGRECAHTPEPKNERDVKVINILKVSAGNVIEKFGLSQAWITCKECEKLCSEDWRWIAFNGDFGLLIRQAEMATSREDDGSNWCWFYMLSPCRTSYRHAVWAIGIASTVCDSSSHWVLETGTRSN